MPRQRRTGHQAQTRAAQNLDDLADFEQFRQEVLPKLREMIRKGKKAEDFYAWAESYLAARAVTVALTSENDATALAAVKEAFDRIKGKSTEKKEVTHSYAQLTDEQLDALLKSKEEEIGDESPIN